MRVDRGALLLCKPIYALRTAHAIAVGMVLGGRVKKSLQRHQAMNGRHWSARSRSTLSLAAHDGEELLRHRFLGSLCLCFCILQSSVTIG